MCELHTVKKRSEMLYRSVAEFMPLCGKCTIMDPTKWGPRSVLYPILCYTCPHYDGGLLYVFPKKFASPIDMLILLASKFEKCVHNGANNTSEIPNNFTSIGSFTKYIKMKQKLNKYASIINLINIKVQIKV